MLIGCMVRYIPDSPTDLNTGNRIEGATGCPSWCRPLRPLFYFLCSNLKANPVVCGGDMFRRFCNMFSESFPCLLGQHDSCRAAQLPVELSENIFQNLWNKLPPQTLVHLSYNHSPILAELDCELHRFARHSSNWRDNWLTRIMSLLDSLLRASANCCLSFGL